MRDIRKKIAALADWLKAVKEELSKPQTPSLLELISTYYTARSAGAWSHKAKARNLQQFAEAINYLTGKGLLTLEDFQAHLAAHRRQTEAINRSMKTMSARKEELEELLRFTDLYRETKPIYDELQSIKWKGRREKFELEHERELKVFHMARRKLEKHRSSAGKIPAQAWRQEVTAIQRKYQAEYERYKPMREDLLKLLQVKNCVDTVLRQQEPAQEKRREVER